MKNVKCPFVLICNFAFDKAKSFFRRSQNRLFLWSFLIILSYLLPWISLYAFGYKYGILIFNITVETPKVLQSFKNVFGVDLRGYFLFLPILFVVGVILVLNFLANFKKYISDRFFYLINVFVGLGNLIIILAFYLKYKELLHQLEQNITNFIFFEDFKIQLGGGFYFLFLGSLALFFESLILSFKNIKRR